MLVLVRRDKSNLEATEMNDDLRLLSATAIARLIRTGELTSREAVETHIEHIARVNPSINAVVRDRFAEARAEADAADALRASTSAGSLPPFHGVPCTIKETFALTGMPNSAGLFRRKDVVAESDAPTVARLRRAGAIPLGVTNTSELAMWMESNNKVYGRSNNPYDPTRIVGGSSGGEAAIIGAGGSPFGLGSDIGGSIRGPCFFNGIFGHKPTGGLVPNTGQYPMVQNRTLRILATGPMARRAEDLMPLLRILAGPDGEDAACRPMQLGDPAAVDLRGRVLVNVEDNGALEVSADLRDAQTRAVSALGARGMRVRSARFRGLKKQFEIWSAMMGRERDVPFAKMLKQGRKMYPVWELAKLLAGRSEHTMMAILLALVEPLPDLLPATSRKLIAIAATLRQEILDAIGEEGVMLYPTYVTPAPRHGLPALESLVLRMPFAYQGIVNVLELPATQVPLGLNARGLPLGIQVISAHGNDHVTIAIAQELERTFGGWVPPFPSSSTSRTKPEASKAA
jgi:fatty acid amide hydrolase 2